MSRRIYTPADIARLRVAAADSKARAMTAVKAPTDKAADDYTSTLLKLIPADVVAVFLAIDGAVQSTHKIPAAAYWLITGLIAVLTFFYVIKVGTEKPLAPPRTQASLSTLAFLMWVFAIGGPFVYAGLPWYDKAYAAAFLPVFTLVLPLLLPSKTVAPVESVPAPGR